MDDLATRLAAHPRFRPFRGMVVRSLDGAVWTVAAVRGAGILATDEDGFSVWVAPNGYVPDLTDPATAGCLRAQLHEAAPDVDMDWWAHRSEWQAWPPALDAQLPIAADPICGRCIAAALLAVWGPA